MRRYGLRDDQWDRIKDVLPGRKGHVGVTARDNRLFVEAVLFRYRAGIPWRDLPERFGYWKAVHTRHGRWAKTGVGVRLEVTEAVLNHVAGTRGGLVGVYQRHDFLAEKRHALDAWAAEVERIVTASHHLALIHIGASMLWMR